MSGVTDANAGSSSSSSKPTSANPLSSNAAPAPAAVTEADDNDSSSSSDEDEDGASTATGGLSSPSNATSTPSSDGKLLASGNSRDGKVSDEVVSQVQRAVTESHGPSAASSVTKSNLAKNDKHSSLNAAYLFYYATDAVFQSSPPPPSSSSTGGSSSSSPASERSLALASGKEAWQCNALTNLTPTELSDESSVTSWDSEPPSIKSALKTRLNLLINTLLIIARDFGFDVVNCVTVMDNPLFLQEQKFGPGDGFLRFYLFNWRTKPIAGGMGSRPGEAELDPVQQYAKSMAKKASSGQEDVKGLAEELIRKAAKNPADVGSGNGIVMV
ncbi:hypothetical protein NDA10_005676 [Ustilago hordei]|nr:hypothetical protein NDA10_005676 [Ustilago hordei]